jgi:hypothetical protein
MFRSNTVFVLGAGSSFEAGMPLGKDLKNKVANSLNIKLDSLHRFDPGCDQSIVQAIWADMERAKVWKKDLSPYLETFNIIRNAAPHAASIDNSLLMKKMICYNCLEKLQFVIVY